MSVLSLDPDTTRRPSGNTATPRTYAETTRRPSGNTATPRTYNDDRSQKYYTKRTPRAERNPRAKFNISIYQYTNKEKKFFSEDYPNQIPVPNWEYDDDGTKT